MTFTKFFKKKDKRYYQKVKLCEIYLKKVQESRVTYHIYLNNRLCDYENAYIWKYIQNDIIYEFLKHSNTFIYINNKEYADVYCDYQSGIDSELIRMSKHNFNIDNVNGEVIFISPSVYNAEIVLDMMEGTSAWDYADLVSIYAFENKGNVDIYRKILQGTEFADNEFKLCIKPSGDSQGLAITINSEKIKEEQIMSNLQSVLHKYGIKLVIT